MPFFLFFFFFSELLSGSCAELLELSPSSLLRVCGAPYDWLDVTDNETPTVLFAFVAVKF